MWNKRAECDGDMKELTSKYYAIYRSLPENKQKELMSEGFKGVAINWDYVKRMAGVIQEPIIRQRLRDNVRERSEHVDS